MADQLPAPSLRMLVLTQYPSVPFHEPVSTTRRAVGAVKVNVAMPTASSTGFGDATCDKPA